MLLSNRRGPKMKDFFSKVRKIVVLKLQDEEQDNTIC